MNKYNSESWAKDANQPAIAGRYGDLHIFMDHIELCVQPTQAVKMEEMFYELEDKIDAEKIEAEKIGDTFKQLFKRK